MPVARVQMPDGRIARLEVPAGTTPEQVESFVFNGMKQPDKIDRQAMTPEKPSTLVRLGRGFADVTEGVTQGAMMLKDLMTGGNSADGYTKARSEELAAYERGRGEEAGIDWMRLGGNVLATAPIGGVGGQAATVPLKMLVGAGQGATASGLMFTPEGQSKGEQIALGGMLGGAVPAVAAGVKRAVAPAVQRVGDLLKGPNLPNLAGEIQIKLQQQGLDWNKLTNQAKDALLKDAQAIVSTGGTLDDAMLKNKALIEAVGAKGTKAAVTRAPRDWQAQKNMRGIVGVGDEIVTRESDDAKAMVDYLGKLRAGTGGRAADAIEAGESTVGAIRAADAAKKTVVDDLYKGARDHLGRASPMDSKGFSDAANLALDEGMLGAYLPGEARSILNDIATGKVPFNVNTAVQYDSILSAAQRSAGKGSPQALAIGKVRDALNSAGIGDNVGADAKAAFDSARKAAAQRFGEQDASTGIRAAVDDIAPDKFVQRFIIGAPARDMKATLAELGKTAQGKSAIADVKGHVLDTLLLKSTGSTNLDDVAGKPFSGVKFGKALDSIEPEKLHALFSPAEVDALRTLQKASKLLTEEVPFSDVNHSKTASALANLFLKIGSTPLLGQLVSPIIGTAKVGMDWVKNEQTRKQVAEALLASAGKAGARKALPVLPLERFAPGAAAAAANQPSDQQ